jgi:rhodanese-related sulfurtransferase
MEPSKSDLAGEREPRFLLDDARRDRQTDALPFAGVVAPRDAWALVQAGIATLVDVRSPEELKFVGRVPGSVHVAWARGIDLTRNSDFVMELEASVGKDDVILFLCRSGKRSAAAAAVATAAGFAHAYNVLEGFEGERNGHQQRGLADGWRFHGLPWVQD